jgi:hypothetical protein
VKLIHGVTGYSRKSEVEAGAGGLGVFSPVDDGKGSLSFEPRRPVTNRAQIFKEAHIAERSENRIIEGGRAFEATHAKRDVVEQSDLRTSTAVTRIGYTGPIRDGASLAPPFGSPDGCPPQQVLA